MILRIGIFLICFFICSGVFAQIQTNQQIIENNTTLMLDSIRANLPDSMSLIAFKTSVTNKEIKSFLLNQFVQYFAKKEITVSLDSASYSVVFEHYDTKTEYREEKSGLLGLNRELERIIFQNASGFLIDSRHMIIIDSFQFDRINRDIIQFKDLSWIEESQYNFCKGIITKTVNWTKFIEPGIVIVSVAGIVYLLFSMRF